MTARNINTSEAQIERDPNDILIDNFRSAAGKITRPSPHSRIEPGSLSELDGEDIQCLTNFMTLIIAEGAQTSFTPHQVREISRIFNSIPSYFSFGDSNAHSIEHWHYLFSEVGCS